MWYAGIYDWFYIFFYNTITLFSMIPKPSDKENIWEELNISYNWNQLP